MSFFIETAEDGSYGALTTAGYAASIILLIVVFVAGLAIINRSLKMTAKQLAFSAVSIAIAFVLSYIELWRMPWGGSVTLLSMLFVTMVGYWYGPSVGLTAAFAYSMLQFVQSGGTYMLSPLQVCMDYLFAFTALGLSGCFRNRKNGLVTGYLFAVFMRGVFHTIGGYLYWMDYMPDNFPKQFAAIYPIAYNYAYLAIEAVITVIVISLPPVRKALGKVKEMAAA